VNSHLKGAMAAKALRAKHTMGLFRDRIRAKIPGVIAGARFDMTSKPFSKLHEKSSREHDVF